MEGPADGRGSKISQNFVRIGLAMEALLWAFLGGWAACYFASGRDEASNSHAAGPAGPPETGPEGHAGESVSRGSGPSA